MSDVKLINCPACAKQVSIEATSCPGCGQPLAKGNTQHNNSTQPTQGNTTQNNDTKPAKKNKWLSIIGFLVLCGVIGSFIGGNKEKETKKEDSNRVFAFSEQDFISDLERTLSQHAKEYVLKKMTAVEKKTLNISDPNESAYIVLNKAMMLTIAHNEQNVVKFITLVIPSMGKNPAEFLTFSVVLATRITVKQSKESIRDADAEDFSKFFIEIGKSPTQEKTFFGRYFSAHYSNTSNNVGILSFVPK